MGNPAVRENQEKAAGQEEQFHPLTDMPADDVLVGSSQAKESGFGDPWEEEGGQG